MTGEFTVFGFGNEPYEITGLRFPSARQECSVYRIDDPTELPVPAEALSTMIIQRKSRPMLISDILLESARCVSCHNDPLFDLQAISNSDPNAGFETCAVCHGHDAEGRSPQPSRLNSPVSTR